MRMKGILALGLVLVGSLIEARASWLTSFDTAKNEAAAKGQPILMNFTGSDWCPACKQIAPVLRSSEFLAFAGDNVVLVEIDFPRYRAQAALEQQANRVLAQKYGISGYPTLLLVHANGSVIEQVPPSLKPSQLIMTVRSLLNTGDGKRRPVLPPRKDRDFPPEPVQELPMFGGAKTHPPQVYTNLVVRTISGKASRRFALINSETFSVGDSVSLKLGNNKVRVQCLEIGERSVTVRIEGESASRTLLLSDIRR
jgi:thiol-disulfide isomerase/thioredoxin